MVLNKNSLPRRSRQSSTLGSKGRQGNCLLLYLKKAVLWIPAANLVLIYFIVSQRMIDDVDTACSEDSFQNSVLPGHIDTSACLNGCSGHGLCLHQGCQCIDQYTGEDCSEPQCPRNCSGAGTCLESGICLCRGRYVGPDCSIDISDLQLDRLEQRVGAPFTTDGILEEDLELVMNTRSRQLYPRALCHSKQCSFTWMNAFITLGPYLPRNDYKPHFKSCAVVNSGTQVMYGNATWSHDSDENPPRRKDGRGSSIDEHYMVLRLDNAPTQGYEEWVGQRTTHRLVQGDYARMVMNMLGTEQTVNNTKSVVTPSTWWVGGYPQVEKVTYLMAVPATPMSNGKELRAPEHNGYSAFTEVFPGNRRFLISPIFLRRAAEITERMRHSLAVMALDCIKAQQESHLNALFVAILFSLQVCDHIDVYGVDINLHVEHVSQDSNPRSRGKSASDRCCYYPTEEDYTPEVPLCDEITRQYSLRLLEQTGRIQFHQ
mmetsp:Transcript_18338/g.51387  ORF Transcript_18338/g.51387 Transcript_18338/m.51387 type:complete len:487 (+) Transcript_18338:244-1704(+)